MEEMKTKRCGKCGETKDVSEFHNNKKNRDGRHVWCRYCVKKYYIDNKEKILEYKKQYRIDNKEKIAEQRKQYYIDNKERIAEKKKQSYIDNKEKISEQSKQYRTDNKEKIAEQHKQYRTDNKEKIAEQHKQYRGSLTDAYVSYLIQNQFDITEIPEYLMELKRAEITAKREIKKHKSVLD